MRSHVTMRRNRMNTLKQPRLTPALASLGLIALFCAPVLQSQARAQGPQQNGGPNNGGFNGGFNRRPPFTFGTVTAVDTAAGTITVASQFGGGSQTIQTQGTTQITSQADAKVSDLKVGDQVQVQGVPTGITASTLTIGQSPFPTGRGGFGGNRPGGGAPSTTPPTSTPLPATAMAMGTVSSTNPLVIALSSTVSMTLKLDATAKVTKYTALPLSSIKVGDRVVGLGQVGDDGTLAATSVGVNVTMGGMGQGGFGGRGQGGFGGRGQGGFGGRGQGGFNGGGFNGGGFNGGGFGGRVRGGRGGGAGNGGPQDNGPGPGGPGPGGPDGPGPGAPNGEPGGPPDGAAS